MARSRPHIRKSTPERRLTTWAFASPAQFSGLSGAGGVLAFQLNAAALALSPFTIVRSHFMALIKSDQAAAIETQVGAWGMAVVTQQAAAIGITAVPTPITDLGSESFFLHQLVMAHHQEITDRAEPVGVFATDSKAMRKVTESDTMVITIEASTAGQGFDMILGGRFLLKLH